MNSLRSIVQHREKGVSMMSDVKQEVSRTRTTCMFVTSVPFRLAKANGSSPSKARSRRQLRTTRTQFQRVDVGSLNQVRQCEALIDVASSRRSSPTVGVTQQAAKPS